MQFETLDEAISLANDTEYGLAAYVWTNDLSTALSCSRRIRAGRVWVNSALARGSRSCRSAGSSSPATAARPAAMASRNTLN
jgi:acyl-CoA reductase-like NAD-dependent aldehyde dehydrogenase